MLLQTCTIGLSLTTQQKGNHCTSPINLKNLFSCLHLKQLYFRISVEIVHFCNTIMCPLVFKGTAQETLQNAASPGLLIGILSHVNSEWYLLVIRWFMWKVAMGKSHLLCMYFHESREFNKWVFGWQKELRSQSCGKHWSRAGLCLSSKEHFGHQRSKYLCFHFSCLYYTHFLSKYIFVVPPLVSS